ncbi:MAG: ABC transporter permease [Candidatus Micrarchaeia archaeon]
MMGLARDTYALYVREMLIFKKNIKTSIARSIIFPLVLILLLGNMGTNVLNLPIAIVNYNNGPISSSFINKLEAGRVVSVVSVTNQQSAISMLQNGDVAVVLVIPPNFGAHGANVYMYVDSSSPLASSEALSYIAKEVQSFGASLIKYKEMQSPLSLTTNYAYGASASYKTFLVAGIVIMVAAFGAMWSGGMTLLLDRQLGNLKAFLAAPINKSSIMLSKLLYGLTQSILSGILALIIGMLDGATIASGFVGIIGIVFFMFLSGLGFGALTIILAARINKMEVYSLIGMAITLPLWFLSGAFLPTSTLPNYMQPFSVYNPMTYAVNAVRDLMLKGYISMQAFLLDSLVMVSFAVLAFILGVVMFKNKIG